jgi:hypothetical protein
MKNTFKNSFKNKLILSTALLTGVLAISSAFQQVKAEDGSDIPSVTVVAKRMSAEQKLAYDESQPAMQTVLVSAKRLSTEQKNAMDKEDQIERQQVAEREHARKHVQG